MSGPWKLYDQLLAGISEDATVKSCLIARGRTLVESDGLGVAMTCGDEGCTATIPQPIAGRKLLEVAEYSRSWNFTDASVGVAAINAYYNAPGRVSAWAGQELHLGGRVGIFDSMAPELAGKKVAVVGHFRGLDRIAEQCDLTILERRPEAGDLPDPACEYILPEQDFVFITGTTLINKTLPRLLELSQNARVVLAGPTVPLTPLFFERGVDVLASAVVLDREGVWQSICEGATHWMWKRGSATIHVRADEWRAGRKAERQRARLRVVTPDGGREALMAELAKEPEAYEIVGGEVA